MGVYAWGYKTNPGLHRGVTNTALRANATMHGTERVYVFPLDSAG